MTAQSSFYSANDRRLHFGLGAATSADLTIRWPNGATENDPGRRGRPARRHSRGRRHPAPAEVRQMNATRLVVWPLALALAGAAVRGSTQQAAATIEIDASASKAASARCCTDSSSSSCSRDQARPARRADPRPRLRGSAGLDRSIQTWQRYPDDRIDDYAYRSTRTPAWRIPR